MPLPDIKNRCTAHSKRTGERCQNPAVTGYTVCRHHGANAKNRGGRKKGCDNSKSRQGRALPGNTNGITHGAYSSRLPPEERPIYEELLEAYLRDVPNPSVTDRRALERLAILETKWQVAVTAGAPPDALDVLHRLLHRELKALLEGSLESRAANILVYATSNRRHLLPEHFQDVLADQEIHPEETVAEKISLSDRFGLTIGFYPMDQDTYLAICRHLAAKRNLAMGEPQLTTAALRWALSRGARSGRVARQFMDDLTGRLGLAELNNK